MTFGQEDEPKSPGTLQTLLRGRTPLIAILQMDAIESAGPLLEVLEEAGVSAIEVTLRTPQALSVIEVMRRQAKQAVVGAGTLTRPEQFADAKAAGALFMVSPGFTPRLADAARVTGVPYVPGAVTPGEILSAREHGFFEQKFFPAELHGGLAWLKHMQPLFPDVSFCPTGGISLTNIGDFLALPNVFAAGGVFMAPSQLVSERNWSGIRQLATAAVQAAKASSD